MQKTMNDVVFVMANSRLSKKKQGRRTTVMEFEDIGSDDDWLMDEEVDGRTEILDEDFVQVNQNQIEEDDILVHNLEDENEFEDDFEDGNEYEGDDGEDSEDAVHGIDDPLGDYDKLQHELFGN
jgi:hypothetical protein